MQGLQGLRSWDFSGQEAQGPGHLLTNLVGPANLSEERGKWPLEGYSLFGVFFFLLVKMTKDMYMYFFLIVEVILVLEIGQHQKIQTRKQLSVIPLPKGSHR